MLSIYLCQISTYKWYNIYFQWYNWNMNQPEIYQIFDVLIYSIIILLNAMIIDFRLLLAEKTTAQYTHTIHMNVKEYK